MMRVPGRGRGSREGKERKEGSLENPVEKHLQELGFGRQSFSFVFFYLFWTIYNRRYSETILYRALPYFTSIYLERSRGQELCQEEECP